MAVEFGKTLELFKVNGRSLNGTGRVDRGQAMEPIHPTHIEEPVEPSKDDVISQMGNFVYGPDYYHYLDSQPEDHSNTIGARTGNLKLD